jgi:RNA polymerase sigma-70 factor (ECF subfamily)
MTIRSARPEMTSMTSCRAPDSAAVDAPNDGSFRAMFDREFDYVWASLRRLGVRDGDLEDVAQDVFVRVHRRFHDYDRSRPIRPWLFAFAVRCAADWRRQPRHRIEVFGPRAEPAASTPSADITLARAQDVDLVLRALECVEVDRRAVFILYEFDECPMKEIARALGIPLFTGYSRLRLARKEFAAAVRRLRSLRGDS